MSLSAHEKTQFARLTAGLELGESSVLRKMAKKDKATAMHYVPLPSRGVVLLAIVFINFFVFAGSVLTNNGIAAILAGVFGTLLGAIAVRNATFSAKSAPRKTVRQVQRAGTESVDTSGYSPVSRIRVPPISKGIWIAMLLGLAAIAVCICFAIVGNFVAMEVTGVVSAFAIVLFGFFGGDRL